MAATRRKKRADANPKAQQLAALRRSNGHLRQADLAAIIGVSRARVSQLERSDLARSKLGTLQSYVAALGGTLRVTAEFGETRVDLM